MTAKHALHYTSIYFLKMSCSGMEILATTIRDFQVLYQNVVTGTYCKLPESTLYYIKIKYIKRCIKN